MQERRNSIANALELRLCIKHISCEEYFQPSFDVANMLKRLIVKDVPINN